MATYVQSRTEKTDAHLSGSPGRVEAHHGAAPWALKSSMTLQSAELSHEVFRRLVWLLFRNTKALPEKPGFLLCFKALLWTKYLLNLCNIIVRLLLLQAIKYTFQKFGFVACNFLGCKHKKANGD